MKKLFSLILALCFLLPTFLVFVGAEEDNNIYKQQALNIGINEHIDVDDILIDGKSQSDIGELVLKDREMLGENGIVIISATLDRQTKKILAGPEVLTRGFIYVKENQDIVEETKKLCLEVIENNIDEVNKKVDYTQIKNGVRDALGKYFYKETEAKPMIITVIQEV